jgi:hypothetical protein
MKGTVLHNFSKNNRGIIKTTLGEYHRALETLTHIFYVNYEECDENGQVKMFDRKHNLVSDNYFAFTALDEVLETGRYSWISPRLKKVWEEHKKDLEN